jgi:hypothetical protein
MNKIDKNKFLEMIKQKGIIIDPKYLQTADLTFDDDSELSRFWEIPEEARRIPYFVDTLLTLLEPWESIYVWKHMGSWNVAVKGERLNDDVQAILYRGAGLTENNADILIFKNTELAELAVIIFNQLVFGWHVGDDIYIIPEHGRQMIKTDHHDAVHVSFRDFASMKKYVEAMADAGFALPDDLPDETFKKPDWMQ